LTILRGAEIARLHDRLMPRISFTSVSTTCFSSEAVETEGSSLPPVVASCKMSHSRRFQLVLPYAERGSPKYEKAALRWLERYLTEGSPRFRHFAEVATELARRKV
jgi:hypothetical protein